MEDIFVLLQTAFCLTSSLLFYGCAQNVHVDLVFANQFPERAAILVRLLCSFRDVSLGRHEQTSDVILLEFDDSLSFGFAERRGTARSLTAFKENVGIRDGGS